MNKNILNQNIDKKEDTTSTNQVVVRLFTDKHIRNNGLNLEGEDLRDAINRLFPDNSLFHMHRKNGRSNYSYPLVQFKVISGSCYLVGFKEGAELISRLEMTGKTLFLKGEKYRILKREVTHNNFSLNFSDTLQRYRFLTPWLPLDQKNYTEYITLDRSHKRQKLDSIIRGNIIETAKGFKIWLNQHVYAAFISSKTTATIFKEQKMIAFFGTLLTNVILTDYIGIGNSKSHGFGTIKRF